MKNLLSQLSDPRDDSRRLACMEIARLNEIEDRTLFPKMLNQVKRMSEEDSLPVRFFARKALEKLMLLAEVEGIDPKAISTVQVEEEFLSEQVLKDLASTDKSCRLNALYRIKRISRDPSMIEALEFFAESSDEDEALLAIEAIETIQERLSRSRSSNDEFLNDTVKTEEIFSDEKHSDHYEVPSMPPEPKRWTEHPEDRPGGNLFRQIIILALLGVAIWIGYNNFVKQPISQSENKQANLNTDVSHQELLERSARRYLLLFSARKWIPLYEDFLSGKTTITADSWISRNRDLYEGESFQMLMNDISFDNEKEASVNITMLRETIEGEEKGIDEYSFKQNWHFENGYWIPEDPELIEEPSEEESKPLSDE